eukprot:TRINITY_DN3768_c0_g1_i1.p2 TRINITY_DN3768_c0_g1~~TRINITY_DN3768_c0_g1_i1.p2  ORF type:complete len:130 (-),score=19.29 TRINITY_DN3768_c0_g1_i1:317-706(-)
MCIRDRPFGDMASGTGLAPQTACARLYGPNVNHYMRSPQLDLGRVQKNPGQILQLADDKNISRKHATIRWDSGVFRLTVHGKNGVTVASSTQTAPELLTSGSEPYELGSGTLVRVGSVEFAFLMAQEAQ